MNETENILIDEVIYSRTKGRILTSTAFKGLAVSAPIALGYLPVAFAFGVLAANYGFPPLFAVGLSVLTYAGASQFMALGLIAHNASILSVVMATFIINARYLLMSTAMVNFIKPWQPLERILFGFGMTDETFVLHCTRMSKSIDSKEQIFWTNIGAHLSWIFGTILGYFANSLLPDPHLIGLDFALIAMFIALLAPQLRDLGKIAAALLSVGVYILLQLSPFAPTAIVIAPLVGAIFMGLEESWQTNHS